MIESYWWIWPLSGFILSIISTYQDKRNGYSFTIIELLAGGLIFLVMGPTFIFTIIPKKWWYYLSEWKVIKGDH